MTKLIFLIVLLTLLTPTYSAVTYAAEYQLDTNDYKLWAYGITKSIVSKSDIFKIVTNTTGITDQTIKKSVSLPYLINLTHTSADFVVEIDKETYRREFVFELKSEKVVWYNQTPMNFSKYFEEKEIKYQITMSQKQFDMFKIFLTFNNDW